MSEKHKVTPTIMAIIFFIFILLALSLFFYTTLRINIKKQCRLRHSAPHISYGVQIGGMHLCLHRKNEKFFSLSNLSTFQNFVKSQDFELKINKKSLLITGGLR